MSDLTQIDVLLIDDDEDDFFTIKDFLSEAVDAQYRLTWKSNYEDGSEAIQKNHYDVCLLDYHLGARNGLEFLNEHRKLLNNIPTIFLTGHSSRDIDLKAMQIGAADYLVKGQITPQLLDRSIRYSVKHMFDLKELKEMRAQVIQQDRLASLGLLASSLAHEIGTPLNVISGRAELLARKKANDDLVQKEMDLVVSQIERISKLVKSLLQLARGSQANSIENVELRQIIDNVINLIQYELKQKHIELIIDVPSDLQVKSEAGPLGQVILNLVVNSIHAIEEDKCKNHRKEHMIKISCQKNNSIIKLSFEDTGCGIEEKNMTHLFKPFFTTKEIGAGTGLGLATSLKLVQSWGGNIEVKSKINTGTTFTITLTSVSL